MMSDDLRIALRKQVLCVLIYLLGSMYLSAQITDVHFSHLSINDGLSQNSVHAICQDNLGFMWFGTKDGLNRYDGRHFKIFQSDPFDNNSLSGNNITTLYEDANQHLWIGTTVGLTRYNPRTESFRRIHLNALSHKNEPERINSITEDHLNQIWVATANEGLFVLRPVNADSFVLHHIDLLVDSLSHQNIRNLVFDSEYIWAGTGSGLLRINPQTLEEKFYSISTREPSFELDDIEDAVTALIMDDSTHLWVGSNSGISHFDKNSGDYTHYPNRYHKVRYSWGMVNRIIKDPFMGNLWLGTPGELIIFDVTEKRYQYITYEPNENGGLSGEGITSLLVDKGGLIWVGTNGYGINICDPSKIGIRKLPKPNRPDARTKDFTVRTIFEDRDENLWVSARVLYRWDKSRKKVVHYERSAEEISAFGNTGAWSIIQDQSGWLWMGTFEGLFKHRLSDSMVIRYQFDPLDAKGIPEKIVYEVFEDRKGQIWIMTQSFISLLDPVTETFTHTRYQDRGETNEASFGSIYETSDGLFWINSETGLVRFNPESKEIKRYTLEINNPVGINNNIVRSLCPDPMEPDRILWLGTSGGGLNKFDIQTGTFAHYTEAEGLPDNVVYGVLPGDENDLWLSTNKGLCHFDPQTGQVHNLDVHDGLQSNEFNNGAYFKSKNGVLYFGGINGVNYFRPEQIKLNTNIPNIVITNMKIGNKDVDIGGKSGMLSQSISYADRVKISHLDAFFTFEFAALDFAAANKNQYEYRLKGWDRDWIPIGNQRSATFSNVSHGKYTFQVRGSNNDGLWNNEGASIELEITPSFWNTDLAYWIYAFLIVSTIFLIRKFELNRLKLKTRLQIKEIESDKLNELNEMKSHFFANISHEFRTPLTLILGPIKSLKKRLEHDPQNLSLLNTMESNSEKILKLTNEILDLSKIDAGKMQITIQACNLTERIKQLTYSHSFIANNSNKKLKFLSDGKQLMVDCDLEKIDTIVENLISNALKYSDPGDEIVVSCSSEPIDNNQFQILFTLRVSDSGIGISASHLPRIFERYFQAEPSSSTTNIGTGLGLSLVKELVDLLGGEIEAKSKIGEGTEFIVRIPLNVINEQQTHSFLESSTLPIPSIYSIEEEKKATSIQKSPSGEKPILLIVEDHAEIRKLIKMEFSNEFDVVEAADGEAGIRQALETIPDMIITDLMMPGMDGNTMCVQLRKDQKTSHIPIIMLTAKATKMAQILGIETGADDYIVKPFDIDVLRSKVHNLVNQRKLLRKKYGHGLSVPADLSGYNSTDQTFIDSMNMEMEQNISNEKFGVTELARHLGMGERQLRRKFNSLFGKTPNQYIRVFRLERAKLLLEKNAGNVSEVCYMVGFNNVSYFSKCFKEQFDVLPSDLVN